MTLGPGTDLLANYFDALALGTAGTNGQPVAAMMLNTLVMALAIAIGKIAISLPSAYAVVFFRFALRRLCFWAIFVTLMLPVEVRIIPTYKDRCRSRSDRHLSRLGSPADRFRDGDIAVPSVLSDDPRRARRGSQDRWCGTLAFPDRHGHPAVADQHRGTVRDPVHLWLEPVPLAVARHQYPAMTTIVIGIRQMIGNGDAQTAWHLVMATALLAPLPPTAVVRCSAGSSRD